MQSCRQGTYHMHDLDGVCLCLYDEIIWFYPDLYLLTELTM